MGEVLGPAMPGPVRPSGGGDIEEWPGETIEGESKEGEIKERLPWDTASLPKLESDLVKSSLSKGDFWITSARSVKEQVFLCLVNCFFISKSCPQFSQDNFLVQAVRQCFLAV